MILTINGMPYSFMQTGEGEPLLLLHGFTGDKNDWAPFFPLWGEYFRVIAVDLPGHGETGKPKDVSRYRMESVVRDIDELLGKLDVRRVHVLGYSMGGRTALAYAILRPGRIRSLILEGASPGLKTEEEREARKKSDELLAERILKNGLADFVDYWRELPLFRTQKELPEPDYERLWRKRLANDPYGLAYSLRGMGTGVQPSFWEDLPRLDIPVLLLAGERDGKFLRIGREMEKAIKKAKLVAVPGAGHAAHVENPSFFGKIVMKFIKESEGEPLCRENG
ncbi:MAG: 2-succinyl-6-hydroxy-2,4-cyclohexadiene-1-carboxylate synthase [Caldibacillus debilis]|uniref:Putative 2-succinyl-6-hydroxy-2,4-cyclohexadiene-1-carboxylate synthase n=1 Tax=Caldibacillus debilis TaxID=301148 RepID=A0A3E0K8A9_9BACI|nr:2-succinyl-6-hydroxy-2,4-cyclohexadiene-1-carboxylate synthase [Caldibacillus debilis]REJ30619.1 MAG: 2-succinyl-6-hydroxy-2,4-cyclohexadiene-1-carboxylate synthase [Caldibacillus debilis]